MFARAPVTVAMVAVLLAAPVPAAASCGAPSGSLRQRLKASETVFVGTVLHEAAGGRVATVRVESVWRGDVADQVQVTGGETSPGVAASTDRHFDRGRRYLFVPWRAVNASAFDDNACSDTRPWRDRYDRLRPASAAPVAGAPLADEPPLAGDAEPPDLSAWTDRRLTPSTMAVVLAALVLTVGTVAMLRRRQTPQSWDDDA